MTKQLEHVDDPHAVFYSKPSPGLEKVRQVSNESSSASSVEHENVADTNSYITPLSVRLPPEHARGLSLDSGTTLMGSSPTQDAFVRTSPTRDGFPKLAHTRKESKPQVTKEMISRPYLWNEGSPLPPPQAVLHPREPTVRR